MILKEQELFAAYLNMARQNACITLSSRVPTVTGFTTSRALTNESGYVIPYLERGFSFFLPAIPRSERNVGSNVFAED
ncbi:MAG: hypothetical protein LBB85_07100 [Dysgonamonadaceae bacterium]|jgi:hypothetical protein|nr:hypothetical protein [Dysgonamonadaceae bacterium]